MKINEIKFLIQRNTPDFIFKIFYKIWLSVVHPIFEIKNKLKLKKFTEEKLVSVSHDGVDFDIYIRPENGTLDKEIFIRGAYEPYFLSRIKKELSLGDTFVDIGTNIGQHSLFAAKVVGDNGKIISFEPIVRLYEQIIKNVKVNNLQNMFVYNVACGESESIATIYKRDENIGGSSLVTRIDRKDSEEIKVIAADSILTKEEKINFIKIDVEGYEYFALLGLSETIKKFHPTILIEFTPYLYNLSDKSHGQKILDLLKNSGYTMYDLEHNDKVVDEDFMDFINTEKILQTNLLCKYE